MKFYGLHINTPLSLAHNLAFYDESVIGRLHKETDREIWIDEIDRMSSHSAGLAWRVVDARWGYEDTMMTLFRCFDVNGVMLPQATIGIKWDGLQQTPQNSIRGPFGYPPRSNYFYIPPDNRFHTQNTGGYLAQVLDTENPSEGIAFGIHKQGPHHKALIIDFRLIALGANYPNDLPLKPR